jgi:hypothetical protein
MIKKHYIERGRKVNKKKQDCGPGKKTGRLMKYSGNGSPVMFHRMGPITTIRILWLNWRYCRDGILYPES